ncbi:transcription factor MYB119-like [Bidens hawaiensis]|uniref:transcription factor MYB119-like n=1 Tax=Bidens hawaiensis TaxID=980011 RepID=UPI004048F7DE
MDRGHDNSFFDGDQGGGVPKFPNSCTIPLNSPWYTPTPQLAPTNSFVWNQTLQNLKNQDERLITFNPLGNFSSSKVPIIPSFVMDQNLDIDNMFQDRGQYLTLEVLRNYPNMDFTNQVIIPSNPILDSGFSTSRKYTKKLWTVEEDSKLNALVSELGTKNWSRISSFMGGRAGKQCRERWYNNLHPDIKLDAWTEEEEQILIDSHERIGNKWSQIAKLLPGRTENAIKNHWNAATRKKTMRLNRNKRDEPDNPKPRSTLLRDYIRGLSSTKKSTTNINATLGKLTAFQPNEPPSNSFSSDSPSISLVPTYDEEFNFMKNLFSTEPMVQANVNSQGFNGNAEYRTSSSSIPNEDNSDMHLINNSQTATQPFSDAYLSRPMGEPVYGYGDMNMDLAFNALGGDLSSF